MSGQCIIHMIHVAGTRMINQGTDGLSRGDKTAGVMGGESMLSFVPLHLTAVERSPQILEWISDICQSGDHDCRTFQVLTPSDWPTSLLNPNYYIWIPPPTIADVAGEYMAQSIHKRSNATHIFICPRLMTSRWTRIVRKASEVCFTVPIGSSLWITDQHEPLMIYISLPLSRDRPWKHGGTQYCEHLGKFLPSLLHSDLSRASTVLRECFVRAWGMAQV